MLSTITFIFSVLGIGAGLLCTVGSLVQRPPPKGQTFHPSPIPPWHLLNKLGKRAVVVFYSSVAIMVVLIVVDEYLK